MFSGSRILNNRLLATLFGIAADLKSLASFAGSFRFIVLQLIGLTAGLLSAFGVASFLPIIVTFLRGETYFYEKYLSGWLHPDFLPSLIRNNLSLSLLALFALVFLLRVVCSLIYGGIGNYIVEKYAAFHRTRIIRNIDTCRRPDQERSTILYRINQLIPFTSYNWALIETSLKLYVVLGYLTIVLWVSWALFFGLAALVVVILLGLFPFLNAVRKASRIYFSSMNQLQAEANSYIDGLDTIYTYSKQNIWLDSISKLNDNFVRVGVRYGITRQAVFVLPEVITVIFVVTLLGFGFLSQSDIEIFIAYGLLSVKFLTALGDFNTRFNSLMEVRQSASDINLKQDIMTEHRQPEQKTTVSADPQRNICFENVAIAHGQKSLLSGVSCTIRPGEVVQITGANGAGKSSLLRSLLGLAKVSSGVIRLGSLDISSISNLSDLVVYHAQDAFVFSGTIRDNIVFYRNIDDHKILETAKRIGFDIKNQFPEGLDSRVMHEGKNLSGGERQLICLTRTLVSDVPVIVLDEFTNHLSGEKVNFLSDYLKNMKDKIIIFVSHQDVSIPCRKIELSGN
ncbi:MAG: ABC transporter ATP-binding protein [Deltaproteobacteria bacterium]|nr:ABC transporter ATP-binding protein [Deltaproteobacteria bacterium]